MSTPVYGSEPPVISPVVRHSPEAAGSSSRSHEDSYNGLPNVSDNNELQIEGGTFEQAEELSRNKDGKMICTHEECYDILFNRRSDWKKHKDWHGRPYKCNVKGCEKLRGFTNSNDLKRHDRVTHELHDSTKKLLFCPFLDYERHSDGFKRKDNRDDHMRRMHKGNATSSADNLCASTGEMRSDMSNAQQHQPGVKQRTEPPPGPSNKWTAINIAVNTNSDSGMNVAQEAKMHGLRSSKWSRTARGSDDYTTSDAVVSLGLQGVECGKLSFSLPRETHNSSAKRSRAKPVRNADGVLIRKDGRPDMRSQSSAANLHKAHARKKQKSSHSPTPTNSECAASAGATDTPSPAGTAVPPSTTDKHKAIMGKIFPEGLAASRKQQDYASQVFADDCGH